MVNVQCHGSKAVAARLGLPIDNRGGRKPAKKGETRIKTDAKPQPQPCITETSAESRVKKKFNGIENRAGNRFGKSERGK
jgi:hypothetical protein